METTTATGTSMKASDGIHTNNGDGGMELETAIVECPGSERDSDARGTRRRQCCKFGHHKPAQGYNVAGIGRGAVVMSNIFLSAALIFLASEAAGCVDENGAAVEECTEKVHGFRPASLITNIAVITGVLSALFMPLVGAMVDFTPNRRLVGKLSAVMLILIQAAQIGTSSKTWFPMAILQAIAGFIYQVQVMATYAYLPEIARAVGETKMTKYTAVFVMVQFAAMASFLIVVIAISMGLGFGDVNTARLSQSINVAWIIITFGIAWHLLPWAPASHELPEGHFLLTEGFVQTYRTAKKIHQRYSHGVKWFFLALIFSEAAANAFTVVSVVYLDEQIGMSGSEIGIFFLVTLVVSIPGSKFGTLITGRLNPNRSWQLSMVSLVVVTVGGAVMVEFTSKEVAYVWAACTGFLLGWFYSTENLFFSMCLPKGQEAELSGFYVYCTQILAWAPPLIFTALIESNVSMTYGVMSITIFFVIAIVLLLFASRWEDIIEESHKVYDSKGNQLTAHGESNEHRDEFIEESSAGGARA